MILKIAIGIIIGLLALFFIGVTSLFLLIGAGVIAMMLYIVDIYFALILLSRRK